MRHRIRAAWKVLRGEWTAGPPAPVITSYWRWDEPCVTPYWATANSLGNVTLTSGPGR